jgi:hypothetical protein
MKTLTNKDEINLILYLETCLVDRGGYVENIRMNDVDRDIIKCWTKEGFIQFGRVKFYEIKGTKTHHVQFSDEAWQTAHSCRRIRAERETTTLTEGINPEAIVFSGGEIPIDAKRQDNTSVANDWL